MAQIMRARSRLARTGGAAPLTVRERDGRDHFGLARHEAGQPAVRAAALPRGPADHAHGAHDQQSSDVGLAHLARPCRAWPCRPWTAAGARGAAGRRGCPLSTVDMSGAKAATAPAVTGPITGTVHRRRSSASVFDAAPRSAASRSTTSVSRAICSRSSVPISRTGAGRPISGRAEGVLEPLQARRPLGPPPARTRPDAPASRVDELRALAHEAPAGAERSPIRAPPVRARSATRGPASRRSGPP